MSRPRWMLLATRCAVLLAVAATVLVVVTGYRHADDLTHDQADQVPLVPVGVLVLVVPLHLWQRHRARFAGLVRGRRWIDVVVCAGVALALAITLLVTGSNTAGRHGDLVFSTGMAVLIGTVFGPLIALLLWACFIHAPREAARTISRRAGWYVVVLMVALYLFATGLTVTRSTDEPPVLLSLPAALVYLGVVVICTILVVEQQRNADRPDGPDD